jgi:methylmalonyl-CoA mutase
MSASSSSPPSGYAAWRERVERELGDADFDAELVARLPERIAVEPVYTDHPGSSRQPRNVSPSELGWHLCPRCEAPLPGEANEQIHADLAGGASALWLRFDRAARAGVDADDLAAGGLAGRDGLAAHYLGDVDSALAGVELDAVPLLVDAGSNALPVAAVLLALVEGRGMDRAATELHLGCDPLAALASDGRVPASLDDLKAEMRQLTSYCHAWLPSATAVAISDLPCNAAGASASEELGMTAATLVEYLRWLASEGLDPELAAPHILLRSAVDRDVFLGIAKLRALRVLWGKIVHAAGVAAPPPARIHAVTSQRPLAARDPWVNMLRATTQSFAAVVGGADYVTTSAWDSPLGRPTAGARRLARNTQSVLGHESALGRVLDPAGGSHYLETLTDELARCGWAVMQEIEGAGGAAKTLASGWLGSRLAASWEARRAGVAGGELLVTGVNASANPAERLPERDSEDPNRIADEAAHRLREHRGRRTGEPEFAGPPDRLTASVSMAAGGATLGEISGALRRTCCETMQPLPRHRDSEELES